jgi:hypothetical protein
MSDEIEPCAPPRFIIRNTDIDNVTVSDGGDGSLVIAPNEIAEFIVTNTEDGVPVWTIRRSSLRPIGA